MRTSLSLLCCFLLLLLSACSAPATATPMVTDSGVTPAPTSPESSTEPMESSAEPPTPAPNRVILLALPGADASRVTALQETLAELADQEGYSFEKQDSVASVDLDDTIALVAALPPDPAIVNLAMANPQVKFLALDIPGVQAEGNVSVIASDGGRPDQQGFIAGYLAAVVTQDWRVGVISDPSTLSGKAARNGFGKGVVFYCGLCRSAYPPFVQYPLFVDLAQDAGDTEQQAAIDTLLANAVKTVYVASGAGSPALFEGLAQAGLQIIGHGVPPAQAAGQWVASIELDEVGALRQLWPRLMAGEQALYLQAPLTLTARNPLLFSIGRQRLVEKMMEELLAGYVDTGIDAQTGESR